MLAHQLQRLSDNVKTIEKHVPGTFPHGLKISFDKRKEHDLIKGPYDQATSISKIRILRYKIRDV